MDNKIKIYTSYFSKMKNINKNYKPFYVSIARYTFSDILKYVNNIYLPFAPTQKTLDSYRNGEIGEEEYIKQYIGHLNKVFWSVKQDDRIIEQLLKGFDGKKYNCIVLLCYEKSSDFCHRHILRDFLNKRWNDFFVFEEFCD